MWNRIMEWLWRLLPDRCEWAAWGDCDRRGVRGNENNVDGILLCDDCHAKTLAAMEKYLKQDVAQR